MKRVAIIGGGISGLCAARRLALDGKVDVQLYEGGDRLGGVIRSAQSDGYLLEWAANAFLPEPDGAIELAGELGVELAPAADAAKRRWVYVDGASRPVPMNPLEAVRTDLMTTRGKLRMLVEPIARRPESDDETVAEFARRRLGPEAARKMISPFVTGVFAGDAELLSLRAAFPVLAELDDRGGLVRGMISRLRERKRQAEGERKQRLARRITAPVHGVESIVTAVAAELGDRAHTGARVSRIVGDAGSGVTIDIDGHGTQSFDAAVLAIPTHSSAELLAPSCAELADTLRDIPYVSVAIVHMGYPRDQVAHALDGFGVIVAKGESGLRVLGVVLESVLWPNRAPDDQVLFRCIYGGQRDPAAVAESDDALVSQAQHDLGILFGVDGEPVHHHVARQRDAIAQYTVGHLDRVARAESLAEPMGLVLAGSGFHGVSVNKCVADAGRVAQRVYQLLSLAVFCSILATAACSGKNGDKDRGDQAPAPRAHVSDAAAADAAQPTPHPIKTSSYTVVPLSDSNSGTVDVSVGWLDAPAALRASPGTTRCKTRRRPPVSVHTDGGVADVVVSLRGVTRGKAKPAPKTAELAQRDCQLSPPVVKVSGGALVLVNDDDRRHDLVVETLTGDKIADIPLPVLGRRYRLVTKKPGLLRVRDNADPANVAYVVVPPHPYVGITDAQGKVALSRVPAGTYQVEAWQRPLAAGKPPRRVVASVTVKPGADQKVELSLAR